MSPYKTNEEPKIFVADFVKNAPAELDVEDLAGENGLRQKQIASSGHSKTQISVSPVFALYSLGDAFKSSDKARFHISYSSKASKESKR